MDDHRAAALGLLLGLALGWALIVALATSLYGPSLPEVWWAFRDWLRAFRERP